MMRYLVTIRNKVVHEHDFNRLPDRPAYVRSFDEVFRRLAELKGRGARSGGQCSLM